MNPDVANLRALLSAFRALSPGDIELYVTYVSSLALGDNSALIELDNLCASVQSHTAWLSTIVKQYYLRATESSMNVNDGKVFTRGELAAIFGVSRRTIQNWISSGLETTGRNGSHIAEIAVNKFVASNRTKKFAWRSVPRRGYHGRFESSRPK
jgi:hypothetical protein